MAVYTFNSQIDLLLRLFVISTGNYLWKKRL